MGGRLVEDHDPRPGQQQPGDRQPLALAARQPVARARRRPCRARRAATARAPPSRACSTAAHSSASDAVRRGVAQVGPDRVVEQVAVLGHHADGRADRVERQVADVDAGQPHGAVVGVVQPRHERGQRRLAGARRPDQRHRLAGLDAERHVVQHLVAGPVVEHGDLLQRGQRHLVGRRVGEADAGQLDGHRAVGQRPRIGRLGDQRLDVEHLEDPLEADQRRHDVEAGRAQRGQRPVQLVQQQRHRDDRAGVEPALHGEVPAEAVDERLGQPRHERQRAEEHLHRHRRAHADLAHPLGPAAELGRLDVRPPEQLDERGAGRREALRHLRRHRRVVLGRPPAPAARPGSRSGGPGARTAAAAARRITRDLPRQAEHHDERQHERDDVRDDAGQRRRERALGPDDVVVEAADQRPGVGPREERDRHRLHVPEHPPAQVEDQPLAEPRRLQPLQQPDARRRRSPPPPAARRCR